MKTIYSPQSKKLGTWLRDQRKAKGLTLRQAGELLGKPHTFVAKTETGQRRLDVIEYVWYCQLLGLEPLEGITQLILQQ